MTDKEQWRPVIGYEGYYEVSSKGRVRSLFRTCGHRIEGYRRTVRQRILKQSLRNGYPYVHLSLRNVKKKEIVHVLVLEAFVGPRPQGMQSRHLDGDRGNADLHNLTWGTPKENAADKVRHGTNKYNGNHWCQTDPERFRRVMIEKSLLFKPRGERINTSKLTAKDVKQIRKLYKRRHRTRSAKALAAVYGVCSHTITRAVHASSWSHIA